jgi:hypothetical protein
MNLLNWKVDKSQELMDLSGMKTFPAVFPGPRRGRRITESPSALSLQLILQPFFPLSSHLDLDLDLDLDFSRVELEPFSF